MGTILPYLLSALAYAGLAVWVRATGPRAGAAVPARTPAGQRALLGAVLLLHGYALAQSTLREDGFYLGFAAALSAIALLSVLLYWLADLAYNLRALQLLVLPVAAVCAALPLLLPAPGPLQHAGSALFNAHLIGALFAYGLFTVAALHATLLALIERRLHAGELPPAFAGMPPLLSLEKLLFRVVGAGFVLLTLTVVSGTLFSGAVFGQPLAFTHKTLFALLSWALFGALLAGRWRYGWRGRIALRWIIAGFAALALAYLGSAFVLEVILRR